MEPKPKAQDCRIVEHYVDQAFRSGRVVGYITEPRLSLGLSWTEDGGESRVVLFDSESWSYEILGNIALIKRIAPDTGAIRIPPANVFLYIVYGTNRAGR